MSEILSWSGRQITEAVSSRTVSAIDVAGAYIEQYSDREPELRAWAAYDPDRLVEAAQSIDHRLSSGSAVRQLEAVPIGIKDVFNTVDLPTEMGTATWAGFHPGNDARVVHSLRLAGALIPGKTATAELSVHTLGPTRNPHVHSATPGTSSSGSAVAVSARMAPVALGTQTGASISRPASYCGVFGMKPSFGLVPRTGVLKTADTLDTIGFFTAHLSDLQLVLDVIRVSGPNYPLVHRNIDAQPARTHRTAWKAVVLRDRTSLTASSELQTLMEQTVRHLSESGAEVVVREVPQEVEQARIAHAKIYAKSLAYYFRREWAAGDVLSDQLRDLVALGRTIDDAEFHDACRVQDAAEHALHEALKPYDIFLSLSTTSQAPMRGEAEPDDPSLLWTTARVPIVNVPAFRLKTGEPSGLQVGAKRFHDYVLLKFLGWAAQRSALPSVAPLG